MLALRRILEVRSKHGIATAKQIDVPEVSNKAELIMVHELADSTLQITALNFSGEAIAGSVRSEHLPGGARLFGGTLVAVLLAVLVGLGVSVLAYRVMLAIGRIPEERRWFR